MNYKAIFLRDNEVPPVVRVFTSEDAKNPAEQRTLIRGKGESPEEFWDRTQQACQQASLLCGFTRWVFFECVYDPPSAEEYPNYYDDERANTIKSLRRILASEREPAEVQIAAVKLLNRVQGLVPTTGAE